MRINVSSNSKQVSAAIASASKQVPFALALALNKTGEAAIKDVQHVMRTTFDRPTPYFLRSLRLIRASKAQSKIEATVWFKDKTAQSINGEDSIVKPHVFGGDRQLKPMELRLQRAGLLPVGWRVVPGGGANLDAYGNISRGQVSQLLNVLNTYREAGYNKANAATRARLAKGNAKKGTYGFVYWVNPALRRDGAKGSHLPPGVYKRVTTGFGTSLKPVLIFVNRTRYQRRLDFFGIVGKSVDKNFGREFDTAFARALSTARLSEQRGLFS